MAKGGGGGGGGSGGRSGGGASGRTRKENQKILEQWPINVTGLTDAEMDRVASSIGKRTDDNYDRVASTIARVTGRHTLLMSLGKRTRRIRVDEYDDIGSAARMRIHPKATVKHWNQ